MAMNRFPITNVEGDLVAQYRNPDEKFYASLELNQVAFPKTGMVVSQTPLGEVFTRQTPCENGMWVVGDKAAGAINPPTAATSAPIGIVYTTEKEYDDYHMGLQRFGRKVAGDYPRVGLLGVGDTVTTNCLQYNTSNFADDAALDTALKAIDSTPLYVAIHAVGQNETVSAANAVPEIVKTIPQAGIYAKIVKYYTIPNGGKGVKYQVIRI
jgi:hypothetical protein